MIQPFVDRFMAAEADLMAEFRATRPESYEALVTRLVQVLAAGDKYRDPDPARITVIDHGDYQGTLLFVIAAGGYQPDQFWTIKVSYGSCSGCDTFQAIRGWSDEISEQEARDYWTLMLHMVQQMREVGGEAA